MECNAMNECWANCVTFDHNHNLDLGFSRSNFEKIVSGDGRADWHGTKWMWVDRMLDPLCDLEHPWASSFEIIVSQEWEGQLTWKERDVINQSIKSSFVKGAGAHPQNAPCRRRSHALRKAPVRQGRLLSTVLHRWSPRQSILSAGLR